MKASALVARYVYPRCIDILLRAILFKSRRIGATLLWEGWMGQSQSTQPDVRLGPRRLGHANVFVSDLERATAFYSAVCGIRLAFREPGIMAAFHSNGNSHHDVGLMQIAEEPRTGRGGHVQVSSGRGFAAGLNHLGFEMENEAALVSAWERAKALGMPMRTTDHGMSHSIYVYDPEGNYLEFYADMIDDWRAFYADKENQLISGDWSPQPGQADAARRFAKSFVADVVPGALSHPRRISRVTILADDLTKMTAYYMAVAGLDIFAGSVAAGYVVLSGAAGEPSVALFERGAQHSRGLHHLSFELADESKLDEAASALEASRISVVARIDNTWKKSLVIADPDGMLLEFYAQRDGRLPDPTNLPAGQRFHLI